MYLGGVKHKLAINRCQREKTNSWPGTWPTWSGISDISVPFMTSQRGDSQRCILAHTFRKVEEAKVKGELS